jgi:hypothetical protein
MGERSRGCDLLDQDGLLAATLRVRGKAKGIDGSG